MPIDDQPKSVFEQRRKDSGVLKDRPDLRDLIYSPTLRPLHPFLMPPLPLLDGTMPVRTQLDHTTGKEYSDCTAQALAGLWDLLEASATDRQTVSARMLFVKGHEIEHVERGRPTNEPPRLDTGLQSLRSIIKAYYHNGVCSQKVYAAASADCDDADTEIVKMIDIAKDARNRPLGSYYRLKPILNDYHAALNEVGAIYAAAEIHGGWDTEALKAAGGVIVPPKNGADSAGYMHAFVIVGYTKKGFLVLNSWGPQWGHYKPEDAERADIAAKLQAAGIGNAPETLPGIALWTYRDWAERIVDGWVLRFGVSAPEAFDFSYGEQGLGGFLEGTISSQSTPRHKIAGHYVHLDDGDFVRGGSFPSSEKHVAATVELINRRCSDVPAGGEAAGLERSYKDVLLWIAGGNESTKDAVADIASSREYWKNAGIYPITVFWCSDFIEKASELLASTFENSLKRIGKKGDALDIRIEQDCRGPGRAFWRDVKASAARAAKPDLIHDGDKDRPAGGLRATFDALKGLDPSIRLHVVAEGAGAIVLGELFEHFDDRKGQDDFGRIASVTLVAPACSRRHFEKSIMRWRRGGRSGNAIRPRSRPIDLLTLDTRTEARMRLGHYGGSILKLVQMTFEEYPPERDPGSGGRADTLRFEGRHGGASEIIGLPASAERLQKNHPDDVRLHLLAKDGDDEIANLRSVTFAKDALEKIKTAIRSADGSGGALLQDNQLKGQNPDAAPGAAE